MPFRPIGSTWGKWDLHFHTPASYDYANKAITNEQIIEALVRSGVVAVAVTDHHVIDADRIAHLRALAGARITIFPGIELRSELGGRESVHLIGIFSDQSDARHIWTKLQGPLKITEQEVRSRGEDNVYVRFEEATDLIHDLGGIVSVHVGRKTNSIENIGNDHPYKRAFKTDLAREHIDIFEIGRPADIASYRDIVFPEIRTEKPLVICSDNHNAFRYELKATCWFKADIAFESFQQVIADPGERVFVGDIPPAVERVQNNPTKYMASIVFDKVKESNLDEDWFAGQVSLNPGLIAVIGNKGTGKTALVEALGFLGNTSQRSHFSFLNEKKFRQPRNNKARHFRATLKWNDGRTTSRLLSDDVGPEVHEAVGYIPQNYLEEICNEIQSSGGEFEKELKSVIFSHVDEADKLSADSLDELLKFLTRQTQDRLAQLRSELTDINRTIVDLEAQGSREARQMLLGLLDDKRRELDAHDGIKPSEVPQPASDPATQREFEEVAKNIQHKQAERAEIAEEIKRHDTEIKASALRQAVAERVLARVRNFQKQFDSFVLDATPDCIELKIRITELVRLDVDVARPSSIAAEAAAAAEDARQAKQDLSNRDISLRNEIGDLRALLDAPNKEYQTYLQKVEEWRKRRAEIVGEETQSGSVNYIQAQIALLDGVPGRLSRERERREAKSREIYGELRKLVSTYERLYKPVQKFIAEHVLAAGKFSFEFEASIVCSGLDDAFFSLVNQGRKGSFCGVDEGRKLLQKLVGTADFASENGAMEFANKMLEYLTRDKRETPSPEIAISDQLKKAKGVSEVNLLDLVFAFSYLSPRYSLKWSGKSIEELSPGERGTLLLIFYLLIDRRDTPLIIDQPEENLDNHTVFDLLVPCIKEARTKRQVVVVTHNPNLAVVCDADQVIHCTMDKHDKNKVAYETGALENPEINKYTIDVLEGTRPAFDHRDEKYHEITVGQ